MKPNYFFLLAITIVLLTKSSYCNAQIKETEAIEILQKIDNAISNISTVVYKMNRNDKYFSRRDTIQKTAICSLLIVPKDKFKAYNILDFEYKGAEGHTYGHRKYDGKKALWVTYFNLDSLNTRMPPDIYTKKREVRAVVQNYSNMLLQEYFSEKKPFMRYKASAGMIKIEEEVLNYEPVYMLEIHYQDTEDYRDAIVKHYVRKSDYLPVAYYSTIKFENMEQYIYYEVEYLALNPDIPEEAFAVHDNENINAEERFKEFKRKAAAAK
jgi:hypothetical protein